MGKNIIVTEEQLKNIVNRAKQQLFTIATLAYKMWEMLEEGEELDDWMVTKIAQADQSVTSVVKAFMYDEVNDSQKGRNGVNYDDLVIGT